MRKAARQSKSDFVKPEGDGWLDFTKASEGVTLDLDDTNPISTKAGAFARGGTYRGIDNLIGSDFADTLTGNANTNTLRGGKDSDRLEGAEGNDTLSGEAGDDTYVFNRGDARGSEQDKVIDTEGANIVKFTDATYAGDEKYGDSPATNTLLFTLGGFGDDLQIRVLDSDGNVENNILIEDYFVTTDNPTYSITYTNTGAYVFKYTKHQLSTARQQSAGKRHEYKGFCVVFVLEN